MSHRTSPAAGSTHPGVLFTALALVLLVVLAMLQLGGGEGEFAPEALAASAVATRPSDPPMPAAGTATNERDGAGPGDWSKEEPLDRAIQGRAVDAVGKGLAGVTIGCEPAAAGAAALATSDRDGWFAVRAVPVGTRLVAGDERWVTVASGVVQRSTPVLVVLAPRIAVAGTVIDAEGKPVEGAMLSIAVPVDGAEGAGVRGVQWLAFSGADGAFAFAAAPGLQEARLCTQHPGHRPDERALPTAQPLGVVVTLAAEPPRQPLCGTVHGPDGALFANASVCLGEANTASAADGSFSLVPPPRLPAGTPLFVLASGCMPVALPDPGPGDGRAPPPLVVQLQRAVAITGRIVDPAGAPLPQWTVVLGDPTPLLPGRGSAASVEGRLGAMRAVTDAAGRFEIHGVFARPYAIEAWDERGERGLCATASPADGLVTLVAGERNATTLRGIVVDSDGQPVAGALVGEERPGCLASGALAMRFDQRATTGVDGRFELPLRGAALHLIVDGAEVVPCRIALAARAAAADAPLRLEVARRRDLLVGAAGTGEIALVPVDEEGLPLPTCEPSPGTFGLPTTARALVVQHCGVAAGVLPWPAGGDPLELRLQPAVPANGERR